MWQVLNRYNNYKSALACSTRTLSSLREMGLEPTRPCSHKNLNLARLPIPTLPHIQLYASNRHCRFIKAVQKKGLEPSRHCCHRHLKPARLPIPPLLQARCILPHILPCVKHKWALCCSEFYRNYLTKRLISYLPPLPDDDSGKLPSRRYCTNVSQRRVLAKLSVWRCFSFAANVLYVVPVLSGFLTSLSATESIGETVVPSL